MSKIDLGHMLVDFCEIWRSASSEVTINGFLEKDWVPGFHFTLFANLPKVLIFDLLARRVTINGFLEKDWVPSFHFTLLLV